MSRDWKQEKEFADAIHAFAAAPACSAASPLPRVRSRRRRVRHACRCVSSRSPEPAAFLACLASCGVEVVEFPVVLRRHARAGFPSPSRLQPPPRCFGAGRRELCLLRVFRGFLRGHCGGVSVEGWTGAFVRGFGESATQHAIDRYAYPDGDDERATTDRSIVRLNAKGTGVVGARSGTDRVDSRTRDARSRRRAHVRSARPTRRVRSCQGTRERDEKSRPAPLRSGRRGQALRVALVATLRFFRSPRRRHCSRLRPRAMSSSWGVRRVWGGGDGGRGRPARSHALRALKWQRGEARTTETLRARDSRGVFGQYQYCDDGHVFWPKIFPAPPTRTASGHLSHAQLDAPLPEALTHGDVAKAPTFPLRVPLALSGVLTRRRPHSKAGDGRPRGALPPRRRRRLAGRRANDARAPPFPPPRLLRFCPFRPPPPRSPARFAARRISTRRRARAPPCAPRPPARRAAARGARIVAWSSATAPRAPPGTTSPSRATSSPSSRSTSRLRQRVFTCRRPPAAARSPPRAATSSRRPPSRSPGPRATFTGRRRSRRASGVLHALGVSSTLAAAPRERAALGSRPPRAKRMLAAYWPIVVVLLAVIGGG